MARYGRTGQNSMADVVITDDDGDRLIVRQSDRKGYVALSIMAKGETNGPCVEVKAEWLMRAALEVNGA